MPAGSDVVNRGNDPIHATANIGPRMSLPLDTMTLSKAPVCMRLRQLDLSAPPTRRQMTHEQPAQGLVGGTAYSSTTTNIAMSVPDPLLPSGDHDTGVTTEVSTS